MDENDSLDEEFGDVAISHPFLVQSSTNQPTVNERSIMMKKEVEKQLQMSCFEISSWCEQILQITLSSDILNSLRDGVVLCRVAEILYPSHPPTRWIESPLEEYMDYNVNISAFGDHCREIGIEDSMIIDYTIFDDRDLPRLTTCLLEYIDFFNNVNSQNMPIHSQEDLQTSSPLNQVNSSTEMTTPMDSMMNSKIEEPLLPSEIPTKEKKRWFSCCFP